MRILTVTTERTLAELRSRIQLAEAGQADRRAALAAILAANPGLDEAALVPGAAIVVPQVPKPKHEVGEPVVSATAALVVAAHRALETLLSHAREADRRRAAELDELAAALREERRAAGRRSEPPAEALERVGERLKVELARETARREALAAVATEWAAGLDRLTTRIERRP